VADSPQIDLNHWRSVSTSETIAMGTLKIVQSWKVDFKDRFELKTCSALSLSQRTKKEQSYLPAS